MGANDDGVAAKPTLPTLSGARSSYLCEVPLDPRIQESSLLRLEVLPERIRSRPIDVDLLHHWEGPLESLAHCVDVRRRAWLLLPELIARKSDDRETLGTELVLQGLETLELGSEAAVGGGVHDECHLTLMERKKRGGTRRGRHTKGEKRVEGGG